MRFLFFCILSCLTLMAPMARAEEKLTGLWFTEDKQGEIEFYECNGLICGRTHWLTAPEDGYFDTRNPDPAKRNRPICGLELMTGFRPNGDGTFSDGRIYDPHTGSTYHAKLRLNGEDQLDLRGYILTPMLGVSQTWLRGDPKPACKPPVP